MRVKIKTFDVAMDVKNNGIELEVRKPDDSAQIGDCYLTKTGLTWCKGRTTKANGIQVSWEDLAAILGSAETKNAALKAAKAV